MLCERCKGTGSLGNAPVRLPGQALVNVVPVVCDCCLGVGAVPVWLTPEAMLLAANGHKALRGANTLVEEAGFRSRTVIEQARLEKGFPTIEDLQGVRKC